jgi:hypothetical protein
MDRGKAIFSEAVCVPYMPPQNARSFDRDRELIRLGQYEVARVADVDLPAGAATHAVSNSA